MAAESVDQATSSLNWGAEFWAHVKHRTPLAFRHSLNEHPALDRESIAQLAESLGEESVTCETAVKPLVYTDGAPEPGRAQRAAELVRMIEKSVVTGMARMASSRRCRRRLPSLRSVPASVCTFLPIRRIGC
jgi:hypothetical protein